MPNHFHFLLKINEENMLWNVLNQDKSLDQSNPKLLMRMVSKQFANFFSSYTQAFNKVYHRRGSLFLKNFKHKPIKSEEHFLRTFLYVHLNPVKHGFLNDPALWQWSSFQEYFSEKQKDWLDTSGVQTIFGDRKNYLDLHLSRRDELLKLNEE